MECRNDRDTNATLSSPSPMEQSDRITVLEHSEHVSVLPMESLHQTNACGQRVDYSGFSSSRDQVFGTLRVVHHVAGSGRWEVEPTLKGRVGRS